MKKPELLKAIDTTEKDLAWISLFGMHSGENVPVLTDNEMTWTKEKAESIRKSIDRIMNLLIQTKESS